MRKLLNATLLLVVAMLAASCASTTPKQAAEFNNTLMQYQQNVVIKYDELLESFDTYNSKKMETAQQNLQNEIDNALFHLDNIEAVSGGDDLKETLLNYLRVYQRMNDYNGSITELVNIYKLPENEFTPELRMQWETIYKDMDSQLKTADKELKEVQQQFAKTFKLKIQ